MSKRLSVMDQLFLASESREAMMHVGALLPFQPPPDAPPQLLRDLADELRDDPTVFSPWTLRLRTPQLLVHPLQAWVEDEEFDLEYHVRRSALPVPGDERELGILVSRLHGIQMDFHRPLWEVHFIEGLAGGRFALYFKIHHALMDGYTGMRTLARSLSEDPDDRATPMFFARPPRRRDPADPDGEGLAPPPSLAALMDQARHHAGAAREAGRALANVWRARRAGDRELIAPMQAPPSILNRRISRNRRFATQQFAFERVRRIGKAVGGTVNDACLALCGAALRRHLGELGALPDAPLIAMLPVNIRPQDDPGGGNAVAAILASLATDLDDPAERLAAIVASTRRAKQQLAGMSRSAIMQYSALLMAPLGIAPIPGVSQLLPPAFNVVVSNVPGPPRPLYFRGARMEASYPLSIPYHGYGLNITINSYAGMLDFGFTGSRDTLPRLQRLAVYAGDAADELERALGLDADHAADADDADDADGADDDTPGA